MPRAGGKSRLVKSEAPEGTFELARTAIFFRGPSTRGEGLNQTWRTGGTRGEGGESRAEW